MWRSKGDWVDYYEERIETDNFMTLLLNIGSQKDCFQVSPSNPNLNNLKKYTYSNAMIILNDNKLSSGFNTIEKEFQQLVNKNHFVSFVKLIFIGIN